MASNAANFAAFERELEVEQEETFKGRILDLTKQIALEGFSSVVEKTPVDTGFARNSWFIDVGGLQRETNNGAGTAGEAANVERAQPFQVITIANGAEYIGALENGHSQQAPVGMVDPTIATLRSKYREIR